MGVFEGKLKKEGENVLKTLDDILLKPLGIKIYENIETILELESDIKKTNISNKKELLKQLNFPYLRKTEVYFRDPILELLNIRNGLKNKLKKIDGSTENTIENFYDFEDEKRKIQYKKIQYNVKDTYKKVTELKTVINVGYNYLNKNYSNKNGLEGKLLTNWSYIKENIKEYEIKFRNLDKRAKETTAIDWDEERNNTGIIKEIRYFADLRKFKRIIQLIGVPTAATLSYRYLIKPFISN